MKKLMILVALITSFSVLSADYDVDSQAKVKSKNPGSLNCESFDKDPNSDGYKACVAMEILHSAQIEVYAKMSAEKYKKMFEEKKLSAEDMKKFNSYLDYQPTSKSTKDFSNCTKDLADEISCPEGVYKFVGGKAGDKINSSLKRNSKEMLGKPLTGNLDDQIRMEGSSSIGK